MRRNVENIHISTEDRAVILMWRGLSIVVAERCRPAAKVPETALPGDDSRLDDWSQILSDVWLDGGGEARSLSGGGPGSREASAPPRHRGARYRRRAALCLLELTPAPRGPRGKYVSAYSKFAAMPPEHAGDYSAAAKKALADGYGARIASSQKHTHKWQRGVHSAHKTHRNPQDPRVLVFSALERFPAGCFSGASRAEYVRASARSLLLIGYGRMPLLTLRWGLGKQNVVGLNPIQGRPVSFGTGLMCGSGSRKSPAFDAVFRPLPPRRTLGQSAHHNRAGGVPGGVEQTSGGQRNAAAKVKRLCPILLGSGASLCR